ncbi:MAG: lysophospholipid acyltransferase family protein [Syntrophales bacterium]
MLLYWFGRNFGIWVVRLVAWIIATGYFFFTPHRVRTGLAFYQTVFNDKGLLFHLSCVWRQFHDQAQSHCDEIAFSFGGHFNYTNEGRVHIEEAVRTGKGGIIVISHIGNWGIAARILRRGGFKMMLIMGERDARLVAKKHREELENDGLKILVSQPGDTDSLFTGIEALKFIREGGILCIAGDIGWTDPSSRLKAAFFDRHIFLPAGPHTLALVSGVPILTLFTFRLGRGNYRFQILPPRYVKAAAREKRNDAIQESAQIYASNLQDAVEQYPYQWHVFESVFLNAELNEG